MINSNRAGVLQPVCRHAAVSALQKLWCKFALALYVRTATVYHKSQCPLMGKGLILGRNAHLCRQPLGYARYKRPIMTKSTATVHAHGFYCHSVAARLASYNCCWLFKQSYQTVMSLMSNM